MNLILRLMYYYLCNLMECLCHMNFRLCKFHNRLECLFFLCYYMCCVLLFLINNHKNLNNFLYNYIYLKFQFCYLLYHKFHKQKNFLFKYIINIKIFIFISFFIKIIRTFNYFIIKIIKIIIF